MAIRLILFLCLAAAFAVPARSAAGAADTPPALLQSAHRILFLGDSITYADDYVADVEAYYATRFPKRHFEFINVGLPSETVSGLSEDGGPFPRPDLHERLARILVKTKPDVVFACYGMNDGIYRPFDEDRFAKFRNGMQWLHDQVVATGAPIVHLTPPAFDRVSARWGPSEYDDVLTRYSQWMLTQRSAGWQVVDVHEAMNAWLSRERAVNPAFRDSPDGIHPGVGGHWVMAKQLLLFLGANDIASADSPSAMLSGYTNSVAQLHVIELRQVLLRDAWLTYTGYQRPGLNVGMPLDEAQTRAAALDSELAALRAQPLP